MVGEDIIGLGRDSGREREESKLGAVDLGTE